LEERKKFPDHYFGDDTVWYTTLIV
jgi:hypothetical protein